MLSKKAIFGLFILVVLLVLTVFFSLKFTVFKGRDSVCPADKITCENIQGEGTIPVCDENSTQWKCPAGSCDTSHKIPATCVPEDQVCQSDGTYLCVCGQDTNPSKVGCSRGEITKCNEASQWECQCDGKPVDSDMKSDCDKHSGTMSCINNEWTCSCGTNKILPNWCTTKNVKGNTNLQTMCDATNHPMDPYICYCGDDPYPTDPCLNSNEQNFCTSVGWECKKSDDNDGCGKIKNDCSGYNNMQPRCDPITQEWSCIDATCTDSGSCTTGNDSLLAKTNYKNRALFSVHCSFADNIAQCMTDVDENTFKETTTGDYLESNCYESDYINNTSFCTRTNCPMPISVPNNLPSGERRAGCVAPMLGLFGNTKYSVNKIHVGTDMFNYGTKETENWGNSVIIVPAFCNGKYNSVKKPPLKPLFVSVPDCDLKWSVYPMQNFHPFLLWRPTPHGTEFIKSKSSNGTMKKNLGFFNLLHITTGLNLNTYNCRNKGEKKLFLWVTLRLHRGWDLSSECRNG